MLKNLFQLTDIESSHVSECDCCKPSKMSVIKVNLTCNKGYTLMREFENIEACECQPCQGHQRFQGYLNDQQDLTEFNPPLNQGNLDE